MDEYFAYIKRMKEMSMIFDDDKDTYNDETLYDIDIFDDENHINKLIQEQSSLYDKKLIHKDFVTYLPSFTVRDLLYNRNYYVYYLSEFLTYMGDNRNYKRVKHFLSKYNNDNRNYKSSAIRTLNVNITETFDIDNDIELLTEQLITTFKSALTLKVTSDYLQWTEYYLQNAVVVHFINHRFKNNFEYYNKIYDIIKIINVRLKLEYEGDLGFSYMVDVNNETKEVEDIYMVCYLSSATDLPLFVSNNELRIKNDEQLKINLYDIDKGFIDINFKI